MTEKTNIKPESLKKIKEAIETIYELTQEEYRGGFKPLGYNCSRVATVLVKRGSLIKTGDKKHAVYNWNPIAMKPNKLFITSVAEEIFGKKRAAQREYQRNHKRVTVKNTDMEHIVAQEREQQTAGVVLDNPTIQNYSIEELWAEIKRRGVIIEDNRLALHTVTYFD